jgi:hypothetical protein
MELSLLFGGSSLYQLQHNGISVGYIEGDSLVLTGFQSLAEAESAGDAGYIAMLDWLAERERPGREGTRTLHVAVGEDSTSEWIGPNGHVLARIIRPAENDGFVIDFTLPPRLPTTLVRQLASRIYGAMQAARRESQPNVAHP